MTLSSTRRASRTSPTTRPSAGSAAGTEDPALAAAVERVRELALRLWDVREAHRPLPRTWGRRTTRCGGCGQAHPCATLRAASGAAGGAPVAV